jgi:chromosome segregation ATPase
MNKKNKISINEYTPTYLKCLEKNCSKDMKKITLYDKELRKYLKNLYRKKSNVEKIILNKLATDKYLKKLSKKIKYCSDNHCLKEKRIYIQTLVKRINKSLNSQKKSKIKTTKINTTKINKHSNSYHSIKNIKKHFNRYEKELNQLDKQIGETKHVLHNLKKSLKRTLKNLSSNH